MKSFITIALRLSQCQKGIIDNAAQITGKSSEDFILKCCLQEAQEILSSRTHFQLDSKQWEGMQKALDSPPSRAQLQGLKKLFAVKTPWKK